MHIYIRVPTVLLCPSFCPSMSFFSRKEGHFGRKGRTSFFFYGRISYLFKQFIVIPSGTIYNYRLFFSYLEKFNRYFILFRQFSKVGLKKNLCSNKGFRILLLNDFLNDFVSTFFFFFFI